MSYRSRIYAKYASVAQGAELAPSLAEMDRWVAGDLRVEKLADKPFAHLPVLGVPGWWPANEDPAFYDDAAVFRPAGSHRSTGSARPCRS